MYKNDPKVQKHKPKHSHEKRDTSTITQTSHGAHNLNMAAISGLMVHVYQRGYYYLLFKYLFTLLII